MAGCVPADALGLPHVTFLLIPMSERSMVDWMPGPYRAAHASIGRSESAARSIRQALELFALPPSWFGRVGPPAEAVLVRPSEPAPSDDGTATRLLDGLGVDRPLVYMTLGTTFADEPGLYRTVLDGVASVEVDVIASTGPALDPNDFSGYPDRVRVTRFVPQTLILPHCQAVVGHAGYGTVFGAMAHGVPRSFHGGQEDRHARGSGHPGAGGACHLGWIRRSRLGAKVRRAGRSAPR